MTEDSSVPDYVQEWMDFLKTVEIRGPIPARFRIFQTPPPHPQWILQSTMTVPNRDSSHLCQWCDRIYPDMEIIFQNVLLGPESDISKEEIILRRVLGMYQHEALESVFIGGERKFDPHRDRWYSNKVSDWRYNV